MSEQDLKAIRALKDKALKNRSYDLASCLRAAEQFLYIGLRTKWTDDLISNAIKDRTDIPTIDPPY